MQISVLAVKCRFCGEEVGKPKEEQRSLSISDLGGETIHHRAPSGSVMDALESFRVEENTESPADVPSNLDNLTAEPPSVDNIEIDERAFGGTLIMEQESSRQQAAQRANRARLIKIAVGVVVVLAAAFLIPAVLRGLNEGPVEARNPIEVNDAPRILERGGPPIEALAAAVNALDRQDTPANRRIAEQVLEAVRGEVHELINKRSGWNRGVLEEAVRIANRAANLYPNETTRNLRKIAADEDRAYSVMLVGIRDDEAEFRIPGSNHSAMKAREGEVFFTDPHWKNGAEGRFEVAAIIGTKAARLRDRLRERRSLRIELQEMPK